MDDNNARNDNSSRGDRCNRRVTLAHRLEYFGFLIIRSLIRALPIKYASDVSAFLWQKIAPRLHRHERALRHLRLALPEASEADRNRIAYDMWGHLGRTMAESFVIDRIAADPQLIEYSLAPEVQRLIKEKRPMVLVSLHLGNWELAGVGASQHGVELAGLYQKLLNPLVERSIKSLRSPLYKAGLYSKGHDTVKTLMSLIKRGKSVGIISDLRDNRGLKIPFFGHAAKSSPFPAILSVLYDAPIIAAQTIRIDSNKFRIEAELVLAPDGKNRDETIYNRTAAIHAIFERWIRRNPEQWMWAHRRWD